MRIAVPIVRIIFAIVLAFASIRGGSARAEQTSARSPLPLFEKLVGRDRDALWKIVDGMCVPGVRRNGDPAPCEQVDLRRGFAVLKDIQGASQLLLIPTRRVTGIEDPALLAPTAPNYWQDAWEARAAFERRIGHRVPREVVGLAINSAASRSQDQLHIHIDCLRPDVVDALRAQGPGIGSRWRKLPVALEGRDYLAMRLVGGELGANDPFRLLANGIAAAGVGMGRQTLVVAGYRSARGAPGFILLSRSADPATGDRAHGEDLLDHRCRVLDEAKP